MQVRLLSCAPFSIVPWCNGSTTDSESLGDSSILSGTTTLINIAMHKPNSIFEASRLVLEKVSIAPRRYAQEVPGNVKLVLQKVLDSVPDKKNQIKNASYFNSGYIGVSFNIGSAEYVLMMKDSYMGRDDLVRGYFTLQKTGESKPILTFPGPYNLNDDFPTSAEIAKMVKAITALL